MGTGEQEMGNGEWGCFFYRYMRNFDLVNHTKNLHSGFHS